MEPAYPTWDSGVDKVDGRIADGETIKVSQRGRAGSGLPGEVAMQPPDSMTWTGGMPLGLFTGARTFRVTPEGEGVTLSMREEYTGPLAGLMWRSMPDLGPSFRSSPTGSRRVPRPAKAVRRRRDGAADPFEALGDPNRRAILTLLGRRPRSVGELAAALPISRPAVSWHLRLLKEAGLVEEERIGTRRIYHLRREGLDGVARLPRAGLGRRRDAVSAGGREHRATSGAMIEPLRLAFDVACSPEHAFVIWTERIGCVVAGRPHRLAASRTSRSCSRAASAGGSSSAPRPGPSTTGARSRSGSRRIGSATCWHLRRDRADATEVEIRFVRARRRATRVEIEHRGWERLGAEGQAWRDRNMGGWSTLLPHFVEAAERAA